MLPHYTRRSRRNQKDNMSFVCVLYRKEKLYLLR